MTPAQSYQLPDLISLIRSARFALRTNPHCSSTLPSSTLFIETVVEVDDKLKEIQPGLLAALCFPTCDAPQLRVVMDLTSLIVLAQHKFTQKGDLLWSVSDAAEWEGVFKSHRYLSHTVKALSNLVSQNRAISHDWGLYFSRYAHEYRSSQLQAVEGVKSDMTQYLSLRRASSGWALVFSLISLVHGLQLQTLSQSQTDLLEALRTEAANILVISEDVMLYNEYQAHEPPALPHYNLVSIIISAKGFSLQAAMNEARNHIQKSIQSFTNTEKALLQSLRPPAERWFSRSPIEPSTREDDIKAYIQGLRDCVAGFVHWMYESEIYFGKRGDEVREFGWVFLKEKEK